MNCQVCGCAACYYNDCCDHKDPVPVDNMDYLEWYDEYMTGADLPSYEKIVTKKEKPQ